MQTKEKKGVILGHLTPLCQSQAVNRRPLLLFAWCNPFKTVSTNVLLYRLWTKKIFVIFSAVFFCVSVSEWGQRQNYIKYIFLL